jgi:hypothetical protein
MPVYILPYFGQIDIGNLEEYYDVDIELGLGKIQIDLNFENKIIESKRLDKVKEFIEKLNALHLNNLKYIEQDYNNEQCDTVRTYVDYHMEEFNQEELSGLVDLKNPTITAKEQLVQKLRLVRLGLYPDSEKRFATFDYSIGKDLTDQLVVINTDENGVLDYMTMES